MALGSIVIDLLMKTGAFENDAKKAERRLQEMEKSAKIAGAAIGGVLAGGFALFMKNTMDAEREQAQLAAALKSTGEAAGYSQSQLNAMADQLARSSAISAGEITDAQTRLLSYSAIAGEQFPRALQLAIDQSVRLGETLTQSAETVGKALEYPAEGVSALTKQGFRFTEEQKKMLKVLEETGRLAEAQAIVMGVMEESYAGAAEAARNTLGGSLTVLKNTFNDLIEGDAGSLNGATEAVNKLTDALADPRTGEAIDSMVSGLLAVGSAVGPILREGLAGARIGVMALTDVIQGLVTQAIAVVDAFYRIATFDWSGVKNAVSQLQYGQAQIMAGLTADYSRPGVDPMFAAVTGGVRTRPQARPGLRGPVDVSSASTGRKAALTEEQKAAAELSRTFQSYVDRLHQANVLFGEQSELARVNYEIQYGSLKGLADAEAELLRAAAKRNDAQREAAEQREREFDAFLDDIRALEEDNDRVAKELKARVNEMTVFTEQAARNMQDAFADYLFDPFKDGLSGMLKGFADILRRMAAEAAAAKVFESLGQYGQQNGGTWWGALLSSFSGTKKAAGGYISGPGTATSDSIPALLSNGEYVIKAAAVSQYGRGFFESLNARRFASGGYVGGGSTPAFAGAAPQFNLNIHNAPPGTTASSSGNGSGGMDIDVIIGQMEKRMAGNMAQGASPFNSALESRYAVQKRV